MLGLFLVILIRAIHSIGTTLATPYRDLPFWYIRSMADFPRRSAGNSCPIRGRLWHPWCRVSVSCVLILETGRGSFPKVRRPGKGIAHVRRSKRLTHVFHSVRP